MARIAYSCCGEGRGHSSRTLTMVQRLEALGHEVKIFASHAAFQVLRPHLRDVTEIPGLILVYEQNTVRILPTLRRNAVTWAGRSPVVDKIKSELRAFKPRLVITDFEPFLPLAARALGIPFISLDHQHVIPGLELKLPIRYWGQFAATLGIVHLTHRGEMANLVTSYFHPPKPFGAAYHYFGPILRPQVAALRPAAGEHVLVYQTSSSFSDLPELLGKLPFEFRIYAFASEGRSGNCVFKPRNHPDFLGDLASCAWVLTNGGYTLISEALHLCKPVLSIPVAGQFEQWINAYYLEKLGFGARCERSGLNPEFVERFARESNQCRTSIAKHEFNGTEPALAKILSFL